MSDPFRLKILRKITAILKDLTPANGATIDLSDVAGNQWTEAEQRVVRGRTTIGDNEPELMVSIIEPPTAVEPIKQKAVTNPVQAVEWDILLQGWAKNRSGEEPCDFAYVLAAEVRKALVQEKLKLNSSATGVYILDQREITEMQIGTPVVRPAEELTDYGVFYLILTLKFTEDMARPFG